MKPAFHVGDAGSNPAGDASTYDTQPESLPRISHAEREPGGKRGSGAGRPFVRERRALTDAIARCHNPVHVDFRHYGARGLAVCDEWRGQDGWRAFVEHVGPRPSPLHTLDRIDNARGYEPGNVRWADRTEQARNRRSSRMLTIRGVTRSAAEWAERHGLPRQTVAGRISNGWPPGFAVRTPLGVSLEQASLMFNAGTLPTVKL